MARKTVWVVAAAAILMQGVCAAQGARELLQENEELRQRVGNLEEQVGQLQKEGPAAGKNPLWSSLDIQFYGYVKADASYDNSRTVPGNYVLYVDSEEANNNDNEFNLTANQTRLGFNVNGPQSGRIKTSGRVEVDFYGDSDDQNRAQIQMRHAYVNLDWADSGFSLLAGQTSDVISPLLPFTLNYSVLWYTGNIGYRRPQIRATQEITLEGDRTLLLQGAMTRTISTDPLITEAGEDRGFPTLQGRAALTTPLFAPGPTTVGLSSHWGQEEYDNLGGARFNTWSVNLDATQPLTDSTSLKGELFSGENLSTYLGGIGQGVNTTRQREISSCGGWFALNIKPENKWTYNVGAGFEDVDAADVEDDDRTANSSLFGNAVYAINDHADVGAEISHWRTHYKNQSKVADDIRLQLAFIYKF
jgi:hypothetical protein